MEDELDARMKMYEAQAIAIEKEAEMEKIREQLKEMQDKMTKLQGEKEQLEKRISDKKETTPIVTVNGGKKAQIVQLEPSGTIVFKGQLTTGCTIEQSFLIFLLENPNLKLIAVLALEDQRRIHGKDGKKTEEALEEQRKLIEKLSERLEWLEDKRTILMVRGGDERTKELLILDRETSQWKTSAVELPGAGCSCGMICLEQEIYIFGGGLFGKTFKLNKEMKWDRMADMNEERYSISNSFLLFEGCIWVFGGINQSEEVLNTVEKYIPSENKWIKMPPMKQKRKNAAAAVCGGKIYVCGGVLGDDDSFEALKSVECFDPKEEVWTKFVDLPTPAWGMGVISDGSCLIIYGGADGKTALKTVWKINPNDANPKWKELPSMRDKRYFLTVQSIGKRIFAIGGHDKKSVEIFDGTSWQSGPELPEICWGVASVVIPPSLAAKLLPM